MVSQRIFSRLAPEDQVYVFRIILGAVLGVAYYFLGLIGISAFVPPANIIHALIVAVITYMASIPVANYMLIGKLPPTEIRRKAILKGMLAFFASWIAAWIVLYDLNPYGIELSTQQG